MAAKSLKLKHTKRRMCLVIISLLSMMIVARQGGVSSAGILRQAAPFVLMDELGNGTIQDVDWHPNGTLVAVAGSQGVWLYTADESGIELYRDEPISSSGYNSHNGVDVEWSPDGERFAVATQSQLMIYDLSSDSIIHSATLVVWFETIVRWSSDASWLAQVSEGSKLTLWNTTTWAAQTLEGDAGATKDIQWHPTQPEIGAVMFDGTLQVWSYYQGAWSAVPDKLADGVSSFAWSRDGQFLSGVGPYEGLTVWSVQDLRFDRIFQSQDDPFLGEIVDWHPSANTIAIADRLGGITIWDVTAQTVVTELAGMAQAQTTFPLALAWVSAEKLLVGDTSLTIRDVGALSSDDYLVIGENYIASPPIVAVTDGKFLLSQASVLTLWDAELTSVLDQNTFHNDIIEKLYWNPNGIQLVGFAYAGTADVWTFPHASHQKLLLNASGEYLEVDPLAWDADWDNFYVYQRNTQGVLTVNQYDWDTLLYSMDLDNSIQSIPVQTYGGPGPLYFFDTTQQIVVTDVSNFPYVYAIDAEGQLSSYAIVAPTLDTFGALVMVENPVHEQIAIRVSNRERTEFGVIIWSLETNNIVDTLSGLAPIDTLAWNPDGTQLAVVQNQQVDIWNLSTDSTMHFSVNGDFGASIAAWGRYLVLAHREQLQLWDVDTTPTLIQQLYRPKLITDVIWSPNQLSFATSEADGVVRIWTDAEVPAAPTNLQVDQRNPHQND